MFPIAIINNQLVSINELEALTVMVGLKLWGHKIAGKRVLIQCDNNNTVQAINTGRSHSVFMQKILCEICFITAINDSQVRAVYLSSKDNRIADSLSRWMVHPKFRSKFFKITRGLNKERVHVPKQMFFFDNDW